MTGGEALCHWVQRDRDQRARAEQGLQSLRGQPSLRSVLRQGTCSITQPALPATVLPRDCRLILETEPQVVASRVSMRGADGDAPAVEQVRAGRRGRWCRAADTHAVACHACARPLAPGCPDAALLAWCAGLTARPLLRFAPSLLDF